VATQVSSFTVFQLITYTITYQNIWRREEAAGTQHSAASLQRRNTCLLHIQLLHCWGLSLFKALLKQVFPLSLPSFALVLPLWLSQSFCMEQLWTPSPQVHDAAAQLLSNPGIPS